MKLNDKIDKANALIGIVEANSPGKQVATEVITIACIITLRRMARGVAAGLFFDLYDKVKKYQDKQ